MLYWLWEGNDLTGEQSHNTQLIIQQTLDELGYVSDPVYDNDGCALVIFKDPDFKHQDFITEFIQNNL